MTVHVVNAQHLITTSAWPEVEITMNLSFCKKIKAAHPGVVVHVVNAQHLFTAFRGLNVLHHP